MNESVGQLTTISILLKEVVENQIGTNFIQISMVLKSFLLTKWLFVMKLSLFLFSYW